MMQEAPVISPQERYVKTQSWLDRCLADLTETPFGRVSLNKEMATLTETKEIFRSSYNLLPPILVFSQKDITQQSTDTRAIFKYGGYAGDKHISIFRILCPSLITEGDCDEFLSAVKRTYDSIFGRLEYASENVRIPYSETLLRELPMKIAETTKRKLELVSPSKDDSMTSIAVVVVPNHQNIIYYITKSVINDNWRIPDQHIKLRNFERILRRDLPLLRGFALHLYIKSLRSNEPPWILRYPSDNAADSVYCGIGFSMQMKDSNLRKSIGVLAICDAQGKFIYQKHLSLSKVSNYLSQEMLQKLFDFIHEKTAQIGFKRLVIYKKGHLKKNEKEIVQSFTGQLKETEYWKDKQVEIVSVEEDIYRLFEARNDDILNVESGSVAEFGDTEALVCVSGHPQLGLKHGTAKLMHIKSELSTSQNTIADLVREYYDRTFLNWIAPVTLSKYPPELNISQNIADIAKEVDITKDFTYLMV
jgi:hypothetical protein